MTTYCKTCGENIDAIAASMKVTNAAAALIHEYVHVIQQRDALLNAAMQIVQNADLAPKADLLARQTIKGGDLQLLAAFGREANLIAAIKQCMTDAEYHNWQQFVQHQQEAEQAGLRG